MSGRLHAGYTEHLFRPVHETSIAAAWAIGAVATPFTAMINTGFGALGTGAAIGAGMMAVSAYHGLKAYPLLKRQMMLTTNKKQKITSAQLRKVNDLHKRNTIANWKNDPRRLYIGQGFKWGSEHAQRAYQVMDMDSNLTDVQIPFYLSPLVKAMSKETEELGGAPWIHGMGDSKPISLAESALYGHTFIGGNVGMGKTTLLKLLSVNALHLGNVLVVLDPKNDPDWKAAIQAEMNYLGMGDRFYHIHPSNPSKSARIPLLKHYTRLVEVADRISPLMGSNSGASASFQSFAYEIIFQAVAGLDYLDEPIRLTTIQQVISSDRRGLAYRVLCKYYEETLGKNWEAGLEKQFEKMGPNVLENMAGHYIAVLKKKNPCKPVDGMIQFALHDEGHYAKMVVSLRPVLTALTANPLDELLSPIESMDSTDERPIVDLEKIMAQGGCLYISLDSLTDSQGAGYIARLITAELAALAGTRYNGDSKAMTTSRRVTVCNDEVHASLQNNEALIQLLAMGRASKIQMILATQTVSDIEAKTDKATADRFLGLCNNFICMRTTDPRTQEYVAKQFSTSSITQSQLQTASGSSTDSSLLDYSSSTGERTMKTREDMFPEELLGQLPVLQYVARLADGRRLKMKLDILVNTDKPGEVAPWVN